MSLKSFARSGWTFFFSGKGLSVQTGRYLFESICVGILTGFTVVLFKELTILGGRGLMGGIGRWHRWVMLVLPALGALLGYWLIKWFSSVEHVRGTDSAIRAYHHRGGEIPGVVIPTKSVASVLTVASGGSAGYEGPVTLLGAAVGSVLARRLNLTVRARRILMTAGIAGGIGALFQAPLAGALFGIEVLYSSSDIEYETVLPCFISSTVSYTIFAYFFGWGTLFVLPQACAYNSGLRLLPYFALALIVTFGVRFYITSFRKIEMKFATLHAPRSVKVVLGGLITGGIGWFLPDVLGTSYSVIQTSFDLEKSGITTYTAFGFLAFFFLKAIATSCTVGSGGSGGVFAPALVCGGSLGASVGLFFANVFPPSFGIHPAAFALVGMAGFLASAIRTPLTAIVMVAEISGNHELLVPAMWVCGIAFWLNNGWTLYRSQVHNRVASPVHERSL